ncbi:DUF1203 domain-containing protein [Chitinimonas naiadis]
MSYRIEGLAPSLFQHLVGLSDAELARHHAQRHPVTEANACPCRITLQDAEVGETVILVNYAHQPAPGPYQSRHAIYVREQALAAAVHVGTVPEQFQRRLLSIRAFDRDHQMVTADVCDGLLAEPLIERCFADPQVAYQHIHFARRGCFAGRVDRHPSRTALP